MPGISYTLNLDNSPMLRSFRTAMSSAGNFAARMAKTDVRINAEPLLKSLRAVESAIHGVSSMAVKLGGVAGLAGGFISAATGVTAFKKAIGEAAQMEGFQTSFKVLLGGADAAKKRLADLSKFAADTPFEMPEVVQASRQLEVMTKGALATGAGLTLVGDVASAAQAPFSELAMWIGRLYAGLKGGQLIGAAMLRLQELGAVSSDTGTRLEQLQSEGASFNQVWTVAAKELMRFSGMMGEQSKTWNGLFSTLTDGVNTLFRKFGEPLIDSLKPVLDGAIAMADKAIPLAEEWGRKAAEAAQTMRELFAAGTLGEAAGLSLKIAFADARNSLISSLADGIASLQPEFDAIFGGLGMKMKALALDFGAILKESLADAMATIPGLGKGAGALRKLAQRDSNEAMGLSAAGDAEMKKATGAASLGKWLNIGEKQIAADRGRLAELMSGASLQQMRAPADEALSDPRSALSNFMREAGGAFLIKPQADQRSAEETAMNTGRLTQLVAEALVKNQEKQPSRGATF